MFFLFELDVNLVCIFLIVIIFVLKNFMASNAMFVFEAASL